MAWTSAFTDAFARANSSTVGNGWVDSAGGKWAISSNKLVGTEASNLPFDTDTLLRPVAETAVGSRVVASFTALGGAQIWAVLRWTTGRNFYMAGVDTTGGNAVSMYKVVAGAATAVGSATGTWSFTAGHTYRFDFSASGSSPTALTASIIDVTAGNTTVVTTSASDSSSPLQATGVPGLTISAGSGTTQSYTQVDTYTGSSGGGAASIALSPTSVTGMATGVSVVVTGTGTTFSGSPFTLSGAAPITSGSGYASKIESQSVTDATHATVVIRPGQPGFGNLTLTDTGSAATATLTVNPPALGALKIGLIGDSITAGTIGPPTNPNAGYTSGTWLEVALTSYLTTQGWTPTITNRAVGGTCSSQWTPSAVDNLLPPAASAFAAAGTTIVTIRHGTNDCHPHAGNNNTIVTAALHRANIQAMINYLFANVPTLTKIILHKSPWIEPNSPLSTATIPQNANSSIDSYWVAVQDLFDGVKVLAGDTSMHDLSATDPLSFLSADGVHWKSQAVYDNYDSKLQAAALLKAYGAPQRYRGGAFRSS